MKCCLIGQLLNCVFCSVQWSRIFTLILRSSVEYGKLEMGADESHASVPAWLEMLMQNNMWDSCVPKTPYTSYTRWYVAIRDSYVHKIESGFETVNKRWTGSCEMLFACLRSTHKYWVLNELPKAGSCTLCRMFFEGKLWQLWESSEMWGCVILLANFDSYEKKVFRHVGTGHKVTAEVTSHTSRDDTIHTIISH